MSVHTEKRHPTHWIRKPLCPRNRFFIDTDGGDNNNEEEEEGKEEEEEKEETETNKEINKLDFLVPQTCVQIKFCYY